MLSQERLHGCEYILCGEPLGLGCVRDIRRTTDRQIADAGELLCREESPVRPVYRDGCAKESGDPLGWVLGLHHR